MAGSCLGELVRKMGERVLRQIIPILQSGMRSEAAATRVGVCTGLRELLENISHTQLREHLPQLLPTVQTALVDPDADVRQVDFSSPFLYFELLIHAGSAQSLLVFLVSGGS